MGVGAIPLSEYEAYFRIARIETLEDQLSYVKFVGVLDNEYLKYQNEKSEKEKDKKPKQPNRPRPPKKH